MSLVPPRKLWTTYLRWYSIASGALFFTLLGWYLGYLLSVLLGAATVGVVLILLGAVAGCFAGMGFFRRLSHSSVAGLWFAAGISTTVYILVATAIAWSCVNFSRHAAEVRAVQRDYVRSASIAAPKLLGRLDYPASHQIWSGMPFPTFPDLIMTTVDPPSKVSAYYKAFVVAPATNCDGSQEICYMAIRPGDNRSVEVEISVAKSPTQIEIQLAPMSNAAHLKNP